MIKLFKTLCLPPCSPRNLIEHLAFQPPAPTYTIVSRIPNSIEYKFYLRPAGLFPPDIRDIKCNRATTKRSNKICCMYYAVKNPSTKTTILYSHGNSTDLGTTIALCIGIAKNLHCNILVYDYSGYGRSTGKPSERNLYSDIRAAFNLLIDEYSCLPEDIILFGYSLGSAPTIHLASKVIVKGVIIQSGFVSALNAFFNNEEPKTICCDIFNNIDKVSKIKSPLLVIHGMKDDVIGISHGMTIYERCMNKVEPLWVSGGHHNDLECFEEFMHRLSWFIGHELAFNKASM